jgi:hypothetical protein
VIKLTFILRVYFQNILNLTNFGDILNFPSNFLGSYRISFTFPSKFISFILQKFPFKRKFPSKWKRWMKITAIYSYLWCLTNVGHQKPCQSAQTASSERAQCVSGNGSSCRALNMTWREYRAISNYIPNRFGHMGLISVVLMSRMKVTAIYSYLWCLTNVGHQKPCQSTQTASSERAQCVSGNGSSCRALNMTWRS